MTSIDYAHGWPVYAPVFTCSLAPGQRFSMQGEVGESIGDVLSRWLAIKLGSQGTVVRHKQVGPLDWTVFTTVGEVSFTVEL